MGEVITGVDTCANGVHSGHASPCRREATVRTTSPATGRLHAPALAPRTLDELTAQQRGFAVSGGAVMPTAPANPCTKFPCRNRQPCPTHARKAWGGKRSMTGYGGSGWKWQRTRKRILERDGGRCRYCGGKATTADHLIPVAQGGTDAESNLVASCAPCNDERRKRTIQQRRAR